MAPRLGSAILIALREPLDLLHEFGPRGRANCPCPDLAVLADDVHLSREEPRLLLSGLSRKEGGARVAVLLVTVCARAGEDATDGGG